MNITIENQDDRSLITISGNIDEAGAEDMKKVFTTLDLTKIKLVVVDLSGVETMGSSAIGKLLLFYKHLAENQGKLRIEKLSAQLYELFGELKLDTLFAISRR